MEDKFMFLFQLVSRLKENSEKLNKAFETSDKEEFDKYKTGLLDIQKKLKFVLKND